MKTYFNPILVFLNVVVSMGATFGFLLGYHHHRTTPFSLLPLSQECASPAHTGGHLSSRGASKLHSAEVNFSPEALADSLVDDNDLDRLDLVLLQADVDAAQNLLNKCKGGTEQQVKFFSQLLAAGPDRRLPLWAKVPGMPRTSRRARLASLRRTLSLTTPPSSADRDCEMDTEEDKASRRRRALASLLRVVASGGVDGRPAIRALERMARQEARGQMTDMLSRRPSELETPQYSVIVSGSNNFEIRSYTPFAVCSVDVGKPRIDATRTDEKVRLDPKSSSAQAFGALAGYLFGKNEQKSSMKMTTPVLMNGEGDKWRMSFVLPSDYWSQNGVSQAPQPLEGSGVTLKRELGGNRAVIMFGGYASKGEVDKQKQRLLRLLEKNREWRRIAEHGVSLAQYNDPFTPPWKRLNEVSVAVEAIT